MSGKECQSGRSAVLEGKLSTHTTQTNVDTQQGLDENEVDINQDDVAMKLEAMMITPVKNTPVKTPSSTSSSISSRLGLGRFLG